MNNSFLIEFDKLGERAIGYISIAEGDKLPFEVKRVFWTYYTPESVIRGGHAHHWTEQILIAVCGKITVTTESADGEIKIYQLTNPDQAVYIPPNVWHTLQYSHSSVQVVLASTRYDEHDYIRDYDQFLEIWKVKTE